MAQIRNFNGYIRRWLLGRGREISSLLILYLCLLFVLWGALYILCRMTVLILLLRVICNTEGEFSLYFSHWLWDFKTNVGGILWCFSHESKRALTEFLGGLCCCLFLMGRHILLLFKWFQNQLNFERSACMSFAYEEVLTDNNNNNKYYTNCGDT